MLKLTSVLLLVIATYFIGEFMDGRIVPVDAADCGSDIKVLFIGFRHGARSPLFLIPNDQNNNRWKATYAGQLTTQGMAQMYKNGQMVRAKYAPLFDRYDPTLILARASPNDRCLISGSAFMAALLQPAPDQVFQDCLNWQPTALYTDQILAPTIYNDLISVIESETGIKMNNSLSTFSWLLDSLVAEMVAGYNLPYNLTNDLAPKIQGLKDEFYMPVGADIEFICLFAVQLMQDLLDKAGASLRNETTQSIFIWSMQDTNLTPLLFGLTDYRNESVAFAATIFFEIRSQATNCTDNEIKLIYRKNLESAEVALDIKGCPKPCSLTKLKSVVDTFKSNCTQFAPNAPPM